MLENNLIKTWGMLAPDEVLEPETCINKRGWSWNLSSDSGTQFIASVEGGPDTYSYPTANEALLSAYLTALAVRREIKSDTHWRHYKGSSVEVVGAAHWCGSAATEEGIAPLHRGAFILEESPGTIHLIQYVEAKYFSYIANRSYGERVCYHHGFQNWARPIGDFLGLTPDGRLRFVEEVGPNTPNRFPES